MNWIKKLIPAYISIKSLYTIEQERLLSKELSTLFELIDNDEYINARSTLTLLKLKYGDSVADLSRAEAILNFLTTID